MEKDYRAIISCLLQTNGLALLPGGEKRLSGDGSDRQFFRLQVSGNVHSVIAVIPLAGQARCLREAHASCVIGKHLYKVGVPVPRAYGFHRQTGILLFEDAGDLHLSEYLDKALGRKREGEQLYRQVIDFLLQMQIGGVRGFRRSMCFDAFYYDRQTMIEKEGLYFVRALGRDFLGIETDEKSIMPELQWLAKRIEELLGPQGFNFFLHRDFQSRNIMVRQEGAIRIIDFQAARKGPLAYDLASLLIDPYAGLDATMQQQLYAYYCRRLETLRPSALQQVIETFPLLAAQRNMQILGAFAFLSQRKNKPFFAAFIPSALRQLKNRFEEDSFSHLVHLRNLVREMDKKTAIGTSHA